MGVGSDHSAVNSALVLCRDFKQYGQSLVRAGLVFHRHIEGHVLPTLLPIPGQALPNPVGALCQQPEANVRSPPHHIPGLIPPGIRLIQKKVAGHAHAKARPAPDFEVPLPVLLHGQIEIRLDLIDLAAIPVALPVQIKHVAVFAALAVLATAVPGIPNPCTCG